MTGSTRSDPLIFRVPCLYTFRIRTLYGYHTFMFCAYSYHGEDIVRMRTVCSESFYTQKNINYSHCMVRIKYAAISKFYHTTTTT